MHIESSLALIITQTNLFKGNSPVGIFRQEMQR